jgi:outer membrane protein OmpA-like peptidoglycan-associated protein
MKLKISVFVACCTLSLALQAQVNDPRQVAAQGATDHANNNISNGINNGLDKTESAIKGLFKKKKKAPQTDSAQQAVSSGGGQAGGDPQTGGGSFSTYANYDFVPGNPVLFEDHFTDDRDGEFPAHWALESGQAVLNNIAGQEALAFTDGNYARSNPRIKTPAYLGKQFTVEYDIYNPGNAYGCLTFFKSASGDDLFTVEANKGYIQVEYGGSKTNSANLPEAIKDENFTGKWHHIAMAFNNKQIKVYVDQYRILVQPDCGGLPASLDFGGIGDQSNPIVIANVRVASGGSMYMLGQKFTDAKIITHGINFDVDKATIKPESMGTLNMIVQVLKDNPDLKFEIDGHTDNTGNSAHNLQLSQQRADAVKAQLVTMGVNAGRLTTKGLGDSKPIADNSTLEGKANNRRVEFVRM